MIIKERHSETNIGERVESKRKGHTSSHFTPLRSSDDSNSCLTWSVGWHFLSRSWMSKASNDHNPSPPSLQPWLWLLFAQEARHHGARLGFSRLFQATEWSLKTKKDYEGKGQVVLV